MALQQQQLFPRFLPLSDLLASIFLPFLSGEKICGGGRGQLDVQHARSLKLYLLLLFYFRHVAQSSKPCSGERQTIGATYFYLTFPCLHARVALKPDTLVRCGGGKIKTHPASSTKLIGRSAKLSGCACSLRSAKKSNIFLFHTLERRIL